MTVIGIDLVGAGATCRADVWRHSGPDSSCRRCMTCLNQQRGARSAEGGSAIAERSRPGPHACSNRRAYLTRERGSASPGCSDIQMSISETTKHSARARTSKRVDLYSGPRSTQLLALGSPQSHLVNSCPVLERNPKARGTEHARSPQTPRTGRDTDGDQENIHGGFYTPSLRYCTLNHFEGRTQPRPGFPLSTVSIRLLHCPFLPTRKIMAVNRLQSGASGACSLTCVNDCFDDRRRRTRSSRCL